MERSSDASSPPLLTERVQVVVVVLFVLRGVGDKLVELGLRRRGVAGHSECASGKASGKCERA